MSMVISFTPPPADQTREARRRRALRQRGVLISATMLLVVGLAALPQPVWDASTQLAHHANELRAWIDDAQQEEREARAFRDSGGEASSVRLDKELSLWLAPHDRLETTRRLLAMARATGLSVSSTDVRADSELLLVEAARERDVEVLGTSVATSADTTPRVTGTPLPLHADRFDLKGHGKASSLLLFCGVLAAMPEPLRLRSLSWQADGADLRFELCIEKLMPGAPAAPATAAIPSETLHDT